MKSFGKLLRNQVREADTIARLASNRFGILLESCSTESARPLLANLKLAIASFRLLWAHEARALSPTFEMTAVNSTSQVHFLLDR